MAVNQKRNNVAYGLSQALLNISPLPIVANRAPQTSDMAALGTLWIFPASNAAYVLTSIVSNVATWSNISGGAGLFTTLTNTGQINLNTTTAATNVIGNLVGAGSLTLLVGTGGFGLDGVGGSNFAIGASTTTGTITIGGTAETGALTLGSSSGIQTVAIAAGTGASVVQIANAQVGGSVSVGAGMTTGIITVGGTAQTGTITLGSSSGTNTLIIAGGAGATAVQIANAQVGGSVSVGAGMTTGTITIGGTAQTGTIVFGNSTAAQNIAIGLGTGAQNITIGNGGAGNTITILDGINTVAQLLEMASGSGTGDTSVNILNGNPTGGVQTFNLVHNSTRATAINIGDGAGAHVLSIGSATGAASTTIRGGTAGIILTPTAGNISVAPAVSSTASPTATVTMNNRLGRAIFTGFTTAAAGVQAFTISNTNVTTTSGIFVTVSNLNASTNNAQMSLVGVTVAANSIIVNTKNNGPGALGAGDNVLISFWIIS